MTRWGTPDFDAPDFELPDFNAFVGADDDVDVESLRLCETSQAALQMATMMATAIAAAIDLRRLRATVADGG